MSSYFEWFIALSWTELHHVHNDSSSKPRVFCAPREAEERKESIYEDFSAKSNSL